MRANGRKDAGPTSLALLRSPHKRRSLIAAASRIAGTKVTRGSGKTNKWQQEAWGLYDQVGELRYVAQTIGNAVGAADYSVVRRDDDGPQQIDELESPTATDTLAASIIEGMLTERLAAELAVGLFVAGETLLVGLPDPDDPTRQEWRAYSPMELRAKGSRIEIGEQSYSADEVTVIRIWRPHPAAGEQADSPVRSSLPVLRELVALTMHISASVDSRLAGAGVFVLPSSATTVGASAPEDIGDDDPILAALMDAMVTPIRDRDSAAGVVPLLLTVPDDAGFQPHHITFSTPLDAAAGDLRDESIRRLALGLDVPPEVLTGISDANHWSAWAVQEESVRLHVGPLARLIARALTDEYLRPALVESGVTPAEAARYSVSVDMTPLLQRPNRHAEAIALYDRGEIDGDTLREASGFAPSTAPEARLDAVNPLVERALNLATAAPSLVQNPGLPVLVAQLYAISTTDPADLPLPEPEGQTSEAASPAAPSESVEPGPPESDGAS